MNCLEAREGLWPPEEPKLAGDDIVRAREHVEECAACQEYFLQDRLLLEAYHRIPKTRAPRRLRERVFDVLARQRARGPNPRTTGPRGIVRGGRWGIAAAALVVAVMGLGLWAVGGRLGEADPPGGVFVEDYLRRAVAADRITSSDPREVMSFLERELGVFNPPVLLEGLRLAGAEICLLEGRRGAMIRYEEGGETLSHYLVPREGISSRPPRHVGRIGVPESEQPSPAVVTWATPSLEQALVGSVSSHRLLSLARQARATRQND